MGSQGVGHDWVTELKIFTSKSHSRVPILLPSHHSETTFGNPEVSYISSWINTGFYHVISFVLLHSLRPLLIHLSSDAFNLHGAVKFGSLLWEQQRRWWHPTPVLLPGKSHGWRSLGASSPWVREESDTTDWLLFHFSLSHIGEGNGNPLQCSCLENPRDGGAWWAAVHGVEQSRTRLNRLSSSSSSVRAKKTHIAYSAEAPQVAQW